MLTVGISAGSGNTSFPDVQEKPSVTSCFHGGFRGERATFIKTINSLSFLLGRPKFPGMPFFLLFALGCCCLFCPVLLLKQGLTMLLGQAQNVLEV